jgi:hypothetical protein
VYGQNPNVAPSVALTTASCKFPLVSNGPPIIGYIAELFSFKIIHRAFFDSLIAVMVSRPKQLNNVLEVYSI